MAKIEGFRIQNYRALKDITLGKLWDKPKAKPLTPLVAVIGKNGSGKSTLFDAFGFLSDCLSVGVEEACDMKGRGGFERLVTSGCQKPIKFEIYFRESAKSSPITYELSVAVDSHHRPYVASERLRQRRKGQRHGWPFSFLILNEGKGGVWSGEKLGIQEDKQRLNEIEETSDTNLVELEDNRKLGIATFGALREHPRISGFRKFIQNWYLSYFTPDAARSLPLAGPQKHLNIHGDNLGNVVQYMERECKGKFQNALNKIAEKIPGIENIRTEKSPDGRVLLQFNNKGFQDTFYAQQMSDGTLKIFAYLLLLEDPEPPPFICIEEPENGLYHKLLETLASEFRSHTKGGKDSPQIFVTTHQPYFVDALSPDETWVLEKGNDGFSTIRRASDDPIVKAMVEEGLSLESLWYSDYLDAR